MFLLVRIAKSIYTIAKWEKRPINIGSFDQPNSSVLSSSCSFTSCKIDKVKFCRTNFFWLMRLALNIDGENSMRSWTYLIRCCTLCSSSSIALKQYTHNILSVWYHLGFPCHTNPFDRVFSKFFLRAIRYKQVFNNLIVNLQKTYRKLIISLRFISFNLSKQVFHC